MATNPKRPFLLFGRFAIPLFVWLIIGPIAAIISWLLLKSKDKPKQPKQSIRPSILRHP
jgi:hypothetical protein